MNSKKATAATVGLDENLILEIVVRLPLKCTIRCMVLNKNLFRLISQQKKTLASSAYPDIQGSIFCHYNETFKRYTPGSSKILSITIPPENPPMILDSCNGVLLLHFKESSLVCVFNPITGETMPVSPRINLRDENTLSLAVDLDAQTIFQFKLVLADTILISEEETVWRFIVLVPSDDTSWLIKPPVGLISRGKRLYYNQFVYMHGCVYYVDDMSERIIVFDVDKAMARCIELPREGTFLSKSLDEVLQCVYAPRGKIEIYSYDQVKNVWQLKHKISNIIFDRCVIFYNGQPLLISYDYQAWPHREFHMYDISSEKWEKVPKDFVFHYQYSPFSFVPTLAKVSDKYMHDPSFEFEFLKVYLQGLQSLVMQET